MERRKMKTIGEQTGIKELDNVRQYGIDLYNLIDVLKVLKINKCTLKEILKLNKLNEIDVEIINGDYYIDMRVLKRILINYQSDITKVYKGFMLFNDTELQEYGIVIDDRFIEDNEDTELLNLIREYRKNGVDLDGCKGNNNLGYLDNCDFDFKEFNDIDLDLIYKTIDEN